MSLLFNLIAKLSVEEEEDHNDRFFSSSPHKHIPYMILEGDKVGESFLNADKIIMKFKLLDLSKEEIIEVTHKTFPKLLFEESRVIGSSRGWTAFISKHDGTVHLSDVFNLVSSRVITLPSLSSRLYLRSSATINISISSPPDEDDDYVVFVKFLGRDIYYCRPNHDSQWTNIAIDGFHIHFSDVIYSPRNQMFFLVITGASYLLCFDLNMKERYTRLHLRNVPKMPQSEWELLTLCCKREHLVESSCGKIFVVRRYVETYDKGDKEVIFNKTNRFMVFMLDEKVTYGETRATYTQDIGDLCIFLGNNEAFCIDASKHPGLKPNSIYYIGYGIGVYDIGCGKFRHLTPCMPLNWSLCTQV